MLDEVVFSTDQQLNDVILVYAYAKLTVTNPEAKAQYRGVAGPALAKHGGKAASAANTFPVLDGSPETPDLAAFLSFPDTAAAIAWANDPDVQDGHA